MKGPTIKMPDTDIVPSSFLETVLDGTPTPVLAYDQAKSRESEFGGPLEMRLAALALDPISRNSLNERLDDLWTRRDRARKAEAAVDAVYVDEIVIGSGFHAAIYSAVRRLGGNEQPVILESTGQVGGAVAVANRPVFFMNSRNRPGNLGLPSDNQALNYIPGAPLQPAMLGQSEYQTNADVALAIRLTLAQYAEVITNATVNEVIFDPGTEYVYLVLTEQGDTFRAKRVIDARGLGTPNANDAADGQAILTFPQFMQRMARPFPVRGITRAAVIGNGDSARCAIESLLGIAPEPFMSSTGLDYVRRIDWYAEGVSNNCADFLASERPRYQRIAKYLRANGYEETRLRVLPERGRAERILDTVAVNERTYDIAIMATGNRLREIPGIRDYALEYTGSPEARGPLILGRKESGRPLYQVGPAADIPFSDTELANGLDRIPANRVAMFRLANRTASLAKNVEEIERAQGG